MPLRTRRSRHTIAHTRASRHAQVVTLLLPIGAICFAIYTSGKMPGRPGKGLHGDEWSWYPGIEKQ